MLSRLTPKTIFWLCLALLVLIWLPALRFPILSDTARYALLGESLWQDFRYELLDVTYALHLPFHPFVSYPFTLLFGATVGMKLSSLLAGVGMLIAMYLLLSETMGKQVALLSTVLMTFHHGFTFMTTLGSADLLYAFLFLLSLWAYVKAEREQQFYLGAFLLAGLACLVRYNAWPLFALFFVHAAFFRKHHFRKSPTFWIGLFVGVAAGGSWFLRNFLVFGDPLYSGYRAEFSRNVPDFIAQLFENVLYYGNPAHNILPVLFLFALFGLFRYGRQHGFLVFGMLAAWMLTAIWWVQAMRFAIAGFPILMGFAVLGMRDLLAGRRGLTLATVALIVVSHLGGLCLYTSGACNALFDSKLGWLPKDLGLTSEGFYAWSEARDALNAKADENAFVHIEDDTEKRLWPEDTYRSDLTMTTESASRDACPLYSITQHPEEGAEVVFTTEEFPQTSVVREECS